MGKSCSRHLFYDDNCPGSAPSSGTARSRLASGLSRRLVGSPQTSSLATDDGWRMMVPEMLQRFFKKIVFHRQLADLALQLGDALLIR